LIESPKTQSLDEAISSSPGQPAPQPKIQPGLKPYVKQPLYVTKADKIIEPIVRKYDEKKKELIDDLIKQLSSSTDYSEKEKERLFNTLKHISNHIKNRNTFSQPIKKIPESTQYTDFFNWVNKSSTPINLQLKTSLEKLEREWKSATLEMGKALGITETDPKELATLLQINAFAFGKTDEEKFSKDTLHNIVSFYAEYLRIIGGIENLKSSKEEPEQQTNLQTDVKNDYWLFSTLSPAERENNRYEIDGKRDKLVIQLNGLKDAIVKNLEEIEAKDVRNIAYKIKGIGITEALRYTTADPVGTTTGNIGNLSLTSEPTQIGPPEKRKRTRSKSIKTDKPLANMFPIQSNFANKNLVSIDQLIAGFTLYVAKTAGINYHSKILKPESLQIIPFIRQLLLSGNVPGLDVNGARKIERVIERLLKFARELRKNLDPILPPIPKNLEKGIREPEISTDPTIEPPEQIRIPDPNKTKQAKQVIKPTTK